MRNPIRDMRRAKRAAAERKMLLRQNALIQSAQFRESALTRLDAGTETSSGLPIIVSLTTHSSRIHDVYLTIESLFSQSKKADRIVLWLSAEEFSESTIPTILTMQRKRGLEIRFCETDLGPYTKFYYALSEFPDSLILTVDDDIMYPIDMIDQLYHAHLAQPDIIHCHRAHTIDLDSRGQLKPYKQWDFGSKNDQASLTVFPTGVGGVLYFPGCFDQEIFNRDAFLSLAPNADDIWLKAMSLKKGTLCKKVSDKRDWSDRFIPVPGSQVVKLKAENKKNRGGNDSKLKAVFESYDLLKLLR